jgi:hypothetical protein
LSKTTSTEEKLAADNEARRIVRRSALNFKAIDIPIGAELVFTEDKTKQCRVISDRQVEYEGKTYYLSSLALELIKEHGFNWVSTQGALWFTYDGETLKDRRDKFECEVSEYKNA